MNKVVLFICLLLALFNTTVAQEVISTQASAYIISKSCDNYGVSSKQFNNQALRSDLVLMRTKRKFRYQVECCSVDVTGLISIRIWRSTRFKRYSYRQASRDAVHAILFSGVSGKNGCVTQKPLLSTPKSLDAFKKIENDFFSKNGEWSKYTREASVATTLPQQIGDKKWKVYKVSISKDLLRKYLEEQKVIKTLNSGF